MNDNRVANRHIIRRRILSSTLHLALGFTLLPSLIYGQTAPNQTELNNALAALKSGDINGRDVVILANANAVQTVPALEVQFTRATDVDLKTSIASGLVKLKDHNDTYWNFLLDQATIAIDSNIPDSAFSESQGKMIISEFTPELQEWAHTHNVSPNTAAIYSRYDMPVKILELGASADPRAVPLLRRALQARNYLVAAFAAKGLALIQNKESIPLIISAAQKAPIGYNSLIADSLIYFDDPQAQAAVDTYMPKENAKMSRDQRARGSGPFGW